METWVSYKLVSVLLPWSYIGVKVLHAKYLHATDICFSHSAPRGASNSIWKGIVKGLDMLKEGYCWRDGDGMSISIFLV